MGINLLDFVKNHLSVALIAKTAGLVGEKTTDTQKAIDVLLPSVLGGLANKSTTLTGADNLLEMIDEGGHDGRIFDTLGTLLGGGIATQGVLRIGSDVINTIFGDKVSGISDGVAAHAGIKSGSASNLMNLVAPLLMGAIGKQLDGKGTASSMIALLGSQLPHLKNAIPDELLGSLGLSNLSLGTPVVKEEPRLFVVPPVTHPVDMPTNLLNKLFDKFTQKTTQPSAPVAKPQPKPVEPEKPQAKPIVPEKSQSKPVVVEKPQSKHIPPEKNKNKPTVPEKPQSKPVAPEKPQPKPVVPEKTQSKPVVVEKPQSKPVAPEKPKVAQADGTKKPLLQQLKPWLILMGVSLFGLICLRMCKSAPTDNLSTTPVVETSKVDSTPNAQATQTVTDSVEKTLKLTDGELKVKAGSFLDLLYTVVTDEKGDTSKPLVFNNVNFEKNKTDLTDSSKTQLNDLVKIMKAYPKFDIKINGYTDSRGDADENKKLSSGRAASVKAYLTAHDIYNERIKTEGFGAVNPIANNETEEGRVKNRRIEVKITKK